MLETLKSKILNWTPSQADGFYSNVIRRGSYGGMIYEQTPTGWYLYSAEKAGYYDLNGKSYTLQVHTDEAEASLNAQKVYSDYADANPGFIKVEKPTLISIVELYTIEYIYCETTKPYNSHGIPQLNMGFVSEAERSATVTELAKINFKKADELFQLVDACGGTLYPKELTTENLLYDVVTQNYFWGNDIVFSEERQFAIDAQMSIIDNLNACLSLMFNKSVNVQSAVSNYINSECSILQLPT